MIQFLPEFLTIAGIHLLAVISPGPDFALIVKNTLIYNRKTAAYTAVGLALGILVHVAYSLVGIGFVISRSVVLFSVIKFAGAAYLIWIGYQSLKSKNSAEVFAHTEPIQSLSHWRAVRMGFLTNILNPKVTLFIFSLFTQFIQPTTSKTIQAIYGIEMSIMTLLWFGGVAVVLSHHIIEKRFRSIQHRVEKIMGAILIALGIKVALSGAR